MRISFALICSFLFYSNVSSLFASSTLTMRALLSRQLGTGRHVALVAGGSRGIGGAFADQLAACDVDLVLVASGERGLREKSLALTQRYPKIRIHTIAQDLAKPGAAVLAWDKIPRDMKQHLSIFIFSAGLAKDDFSNPEEIEAMLRIKGPAARELSTVFLEHASANQKKSGNHFRSLVVLVGSLAEIVEPGGLSAYVKSNKTLTETAQNLSSQFGNRHLISVLAPGFTRTDMLNEMVRLPSLPGIIQEPEEVADSGLLGSLRGESYIVPSAFYEFTAPIGAWMNATGALTPLQAAQKLVFLYRRITQSPRHIPAKGLFIRTLTRISGACGRLLSGYDDDFRGQSE